MEPHVGAFRGMGDTLSDITADFCRRLGVRCRVVPMSDHIVRTRVKTDRGWLDFQDYFVRYQCEPVVEGFLFTGVESAAPSPGFLAALRDPALRAVVVCPSNPFISIDPILSLRGVRDALQTSAAPVVGGLADHRRAGGQRADSQNDARARAFGDSRDGRRALC